MQERKTQSITSSEFTIFRWPKEPPLGKATIRDTRRISDFQDVKNWYGYSPHDV